MLADQRLGDQVRHSVGDPRLGEIGQLVAAISIERAADRVAQAVLVVGGAGVDLAGQLREPVGRAGSRAHECVLLGGRELGGAFEHHRGGHVHEALNRLIHRGVDDRSGERVVDLRQRVGQLVEIGDAAHDRGEVDDVGAALERRPRVLGVAQVGRVDLGPLRIQSGGGRWSAILTSHCGSLSRRLTTAEPIVPAPPVTSTRFIGYAVSTRRVIVAGVSSSVAACRLGAWGRLRASRAAVSAA